MQTLRTRYTQGILAATLFTGALIAATPAIAQNTAAFESAPSLPAADIAPAAAIKSPLHKLAELVKINNYFGVFVIESSFGKFTVTGVPMLSTRVSELQAIEKLQKVSQNAAFQDALKNSATALGKFAETAITDPGKAAESVAKGIERRKPRQCQRQRYFHKRQVRRRCRCAERQNCRSRCACTRRRKSRTGEGRPIRLHPAQRR